MGSQCGACNVPACALSAVCGDVETAAHPVHRQLPALATRQVSPSIPVLDMCSHVASWHSMWLFQNRADTAEFAGLTPGRCLQARAPERSAVFFVR